MKFSEMPYARPDLNEMKQQLQALTDRLKAAPDYAAAREAFLAQQKLSMHIAAEIARNGGWLSFARYMEMAMTTRGRLPCWKARSARNSQRNTAI